MQAVTLIVTFVLTAAVVQFAGFMISQVIDRVWPTAGLLTFLVLFLPPPPMELPGPSPSELASGGIVAPDMSSRQNKWRELGGVIDGVLHDRLARRIEERRSQASKAGKGRASHRTRSCVVRASPPRRREPR